MAPSKPTSRKILLLGVGPLPFEAGEKVMAPGLRLDFFARSLAAAGHKVVVGRTVFEEAAGAGPGASPLASQYSSQAARETKGLPFTVRKAVLDDPEMLRIWHMEAGFDAVVALTDAMGRLAVSARLPIPLAVDWYGDPIAERQMQCLRAGNDHALLHGFDNLLPALLGADRFVVCSDAQRHCLLGELAAVGRLNRHLAGREPIDIVRPAWQFTFPEAPAGAPNLVRGSKSPDDAILFLWAGGYNNWTDVDVLFDGVEKAMAQVPALRFVSAGGEIPGHGQGVYARLMAKIEASPNRDRWIMLGWTPARDMPRLYAECDFAINLDAPGPEGEFGSRSRLLDWARFGPAIVTTPLCELAQRMIEAGAARSFPIGDADALASLAVELANDAPARDALKAKAAAFIEEWTAKAFPKSLLDWAANPTPAPDLPAPAERKNWPGLVRPDNALAMAMADLSDSAWLLEWRQNRGSRLYRLYRGARKALAGLRGKKA